MSKLLGIKNGYQYYVDFDEPDYDGIFNPLDCDNLWNLITFLGCGYTLDKDVNGLEGLQTYLEDKYDVFLADDALDNLKFDDENKHYDEDDFFDDLHKLLLKHNLYCEPITKSEHDSVYFGRGVAGGFDSGVCGIAIVSKHEIRSMYKRKYVTKKLLKVAYQDLDTEFNHLNDDNNGCLYDISKQKNNVEVDNIGGIYMSDFDKLNHKQKLQEAVSMF